MHNEEDALVLARIHSLKIAIAMLLWTTLMVACSSNESATPGQISMTDKVAAYVQGFATNGDFSGVVAVSQSGQIIAQQAFGFANIESRTVFGPTTTFHVASLSKTLTAAGIRWLADDGALDLGDPLARFLPDFPNADRITIRHLLAHQSGVPDYWTAKDVAAIVERGVELNEFVDWLGQRPLIFEPGSDNQYSNSGYALLAAVIENASGLDYHSFLADRIYPTAGLIHTSAFRSDAVASGYQPSHSVAGIQLIAPYDPSILIGAGSLKSTAGDLLKWCDVFIADFKNTKTQPYIYGWGTREADGHRWVEQTGRNFGYAAHMRAYPDEQLCVVVLSNIESQAVEVIGAGLTEIAFGGTPDTPAPRGSFDVDDSELDRYVGSFEIAPGNAVEIRRLDEGLVLRGQNGAFLPLEPIAVDRFFYRQLYVEIVAQRNDTGAVTGLLWGGSYPMPRVN